MSRVLVVGGTGLAGRQVAEQAVSRGHQVSVGSRHVPAAEDRVPGVEYHCLDLVAARGFENALEGVDVLIDTSNGTSGAQRDVLTEGALNLMHAAARWGIGRAVLLSIVNVDRSGYAYYRAKATQETAYRESLLETRVVRATQFHDLVASLLASGRRVGVIPAFPGISLQPIAVSDVARILVDTAEGAGSPNSTSTIGGPEVLGMRALAALYKRATGSRSLIVGLPLPGELGAFWRSGGALVPQHAVGTVTFADWLAERHAKAAD